MSTYLLFVLLGLGAGSVYALLGLGLVLKYRSAGVIDFAHGANAMWAAYAFLGLREDGRLPLPWVWLPHELPLASAGLGLWPALLISIGYAMALGLLTFLLVYRPLLNAAPLTRVCASVGVALFVQSVAVLNFGTTARTAPPLLPTRPLTVGGLAFPSDRLYLAAIVVAAAVTLSVVYSRTRFGLVTRASAENASGATLIGISPVGVAAGNWTIATFLAAVSGILITPISSLDPSSYTLFIVPALGAVLIGRFRSFWITAAAGLGLGVVQSVLIKQQTVWTWLPQQGLTDGLPFIIIIIVMSLSARRIGARGETGSWRNPSLGRPTRPLATAVLCLLAGLVVMATLHGSLRAAFMASIVSICLALALVVLTGYVGQVSLAQMSFAGFGAFVLTHLAGRLPLPFPVVLLLAGISVIPLGVLIGLPALRVRGVNLAVVTLAAAAAMDALVFTVVRLTGGLGGRSVQPPELFGVDVGVGTGANYPQLIFGAWLLAVVVAIGYFVARLRLSATGLIMIAVRSNERAAASVGIRVAPVKLGAFALSSFIAGIGGGLLAYEQGTVSSGSFVLQASLGLLAITYVAGIARIAGAVIAGVLLASDGLFVSFLDAHLHIGQYQILVAGLALTVTAIANPDGIASALVAERGPGAVAAAWRDRLLPRHWKGKRSSTPVPEVTVSTKENSDVASGRRRLAAEDLQGGPVATRTRSPVPRRGTGDGS